MRDFRPGVWGFILAALVLTGAACGKKGPPLTPFVLVPIAPTFEASRRVGNEVLVQLIVPGENLDGSRPAAVSHINVYGVTALTPPPRARFLEIASLVATVPVAPVGEPNEPLVAADPSKGAIQGGLVTIRDTLSSDELVPRELAVVEAPRSTPPTTAVAPTTPVLRRFYMAFAYNARNRPGPPSPLAEIPVTVLPAPPDDVQLAITETAVTVEWEPVGGLLGWLLDRALPDESAPPSLDVRPPVATAVAPPTDWLQGPTRYNVYREISPDPQAPPRAAAVQSWQVVPAPAASPAPLAVLRFDDPIVFDDRERCYYVRALRAGVEGEPSPRRCIKAIDIYPPATPTNLATILGSGTITLIWDPNIEEDLGGYIVLRREAGSATLLPLTLAPTRDTRFTDRMVKPGVRYTYEVSAVDDRVPVPNTSEPAEVSETAR